MNLRRINKLNQFTVGNLNDYINIINKTNINGRSELSVDDLKQLESEYNGLRLSYNIETNQDNQAIKTYKIHRDLYLNIYLT